MKKRIIYLFQINKQEMNNQVYFEYSYIPNEWLMKEEE